MFEIRPDTPFEHGAEAYIHLMHAPYGAGKDATGGFLRNFPGESLDFLEMFFEGQVRPQDVHVATAVHGDRAHVVVHFPNAPDASEDLAVFVRRLQAAVDAVEESGATSVAFHLPNAEYCGLPAESFLGMLRAAFLRAPAIRAIACTGVAIGEAGRPGPATAGRETKEGRLLKQDILASMVQRHDMLQSANVEVVRWKGEEIGTVYPNPQPWTAGATDLFLLRESRSGLVEHAATKAIAVATLEAMAKDAAGRPPTPALDLLIGELGAPPIDLREQVERFSAVRPQGSTPGSRLHPHPLGDLAVESRILAKVGPALLSEATADLDALKGFVRMKRKSQHKRARNRLFRSS